MKTFFSLMLLIATMTFVSCSDDSDSEIAVGEVTLNKPTSTVEVGKTEILVATITPEGVSNAGIAWSSSDENVAIVNEVGVVTGLSVGNAVITATSVADVSKKATCTVTVVEAGIPLRTISLDETNLKIKVGSTKEIVILFSPANATNKDVTFISDNKSVATVDESGVVTAVGEGHATITITSVADASISAICHVNVPTPSVVGEYFYFDKTHSAVKDETKTCIGIIFWIDPNDDTKGKIVSLDCDYGDYPSAKAWMPAAELPDGMEWKLPNIDELKKLYYAVNGYNSEAYESLLWDGEEEEFGPNPNQEALNEFNALIDDDDYGFVTSIYWSATVVMEPSSDLDPSEEFYNYGAVSALDFGYGQLMYSMDVRPGSNSEVNFRKIADF